MEKENKINNNEDVPSAPSTPVTPGTPGAPLFGRNGNSRKSLLRNSSGCFAGDRWANMEEGSLPGTGSCSFPPLQVSLLRKVGAEFIGTFILIFAGTATPIVNQKSSGAETLLGLAASSGLAVMVVILATGHISGAHLNPAITISFAALNHFPWKHVGVYIAAQVSASLCAAFTLKGIFHPTMGGGVTVPSTDNYGQAFALEFIISFNLMFVVTAVATDTRAVGELAAIAVGATVMLNILIAGPTTGGSMNPARTLGPAIAAANYRAIWVYLTAPVLGALLGAATYAAVKLPEDGDDDDEHGRKPSDILVSSTMTSN